jgi:Putative restriction endonuclease
MVAPRKPSPPMTMTVAEFLAWDTGDRSGRLRQLHDGVPEARAPATEAHGAMQSELGALIGNHLLESGRPYRVVADPGIVPRVRWAENVRIPDLAVTCTRPGTERLMTEPALVIETLSPATAAQSWADVWTHDTFASVTEILVLSNTERRTDLPRRGADGSSPPEPEAIGPDGTLPFDSIGLALALPALYRTAALS